MGLAKIQTKTSLNKAKSLKKVINKNKKVHRLKNENIDLRLLLVLTGSCFSSLPDHKVALTSK